MILIYIITVILCAMFWRLGGNGYDLFRNPGVPIVIGAIKTLLLYMEGYIFGGSWWYLLALAYIPALWGMIQAFSYGITAPPHKFWVWIVGHINGKYNDPAWRGMADNGQIPGIEVLTRCTCGFFWSLPAAIFAFISGTWIALAIYVLFLTIANGLIYYFIQDVEINERTVGACVATSILV